jgi:hypothetical protein
MLVFVHSPGGFGGVSPAPRPSARTVFLARVRLAIAWLQQLFNSRQVRTSSEGTCTVGTSPKYSNLASRSASWRSVLFFDRKISHS